MKFNAVKLAIGCTVVAGVLLVSTPAQAEITSRYTGCPSTQPYQIMSSSNSSGASSGFHTGHNFVTVNFSITFFRSTDHGAAYGSGTSWYGIEGPFGYVQSSCYN